MRDITDKIIFELRQFLLLLQVPEQQQKRQDGYPQQQAGNKDGLANAPDKVPCRIIKCQLVSGRLLKSYRYRAAFEIRWVCYFFGAVERRGFYMEGQIDFFPVKRFMVSIGNFTYGDGIAQRIYIP